MRDTRVLWHGTTEEYARAIVREGLRIMPENRFRMDAIDVPARVYLTSEIQLAKIYADRKAAYVRAMPNTYFEVRSQYLGWERYWKATNAPEGREATPAIVKLRVPVELCTRLRHDEDSPNVHAYTWPDALPVAYVAGVQVEEKFGVWRALPANMSCITWVTWRREKGITD